jgi:hypothetical protein
MISVFVELKRMNIERKKKIVERNSWPILPGLLIFFSSFISTKTCRVCRTLCLSRFETVIIAYF